MEEIRSLESDVYLPLNKIAKELGLKESHQYMFDIFNQVEDVVTTNTSLTYEAANLKNTSRVDLS